MQNWTALEVEELFGIDSASWGIIEGGFVASPVGGGWAWVLRGYEVEPGVHETRLFIQALDDTGQAIGSATRLTSQSLNVVRDFELIALEDGTLNYVQSGFNPGSEWFVALQRIGADGSMLGEETTLATSQSASSEGVYFSADTLGDRHFAITWLERDDQKPSAVE